MAARLPGHRWRWLIRAISLGVLGAVAWVIHRELEGARLQDVLAYLRVMPAGLVAIALACSLLTYVLLGVYEVLGLRYIARPVPAGAAFFAAFVASAIGHSLGFATLTGGAIRFRLYAPHGLRAADLALLTGFCAVTGGLGLAVLAGTSLLLEPRKADAMLHLGGLASAWLGAVLIALVAGYLLWSLTGRSMLRIRGWTLRAPRFGIALMQVLAGGVDLALSAAVLWLLLPASASVDFVSFTGLFVLAIVSGILAQLPGGLGVVESTMLLALPTVPPAELLAVMLVWRAVYYLVPLLIAAALFAARELGVGRARIAAGFADP